MQCKVSTSASAFEVDEFCGAHSPLKRGIHIIHHIGYVPCFKVTVLILDVGDHLFLNQVSYMTLHGGFKRFPLLRESRDKEINTAHPCYRMVDKKVYL